MDVVVTSGSATGSAPEPAKLQNMKLALGSSPLAVASGVTCENVSSLIPYVDAILVATGVSKSFHEFDHSKLKQLTDLVRSVDQERYSLRYSTGFYTH